MKTEIIKSYYPNGKLMSEIPYKNGIIHGIRKFYYENDNIEFKIPYKNGIRHGTQKGIF